MSSVIPPRLHHRSRAMNPPPTEAEIEDRIKTLTFLRSVWVREGNSPREYDIDLFALHFLLAYISAPV